MSFNDMLSGLTTLDSTKTNVQVTAPMSTTNTPCASYGEWGQVEDRPTISFNSSHGDVSITV